MKKFFLLVCALLLTSCCSDKACRIEGQLSDMPEQEAFARFRELPAQEKVDVYVWDLSQKRPVASRFEFILHESPEAVASPLLNAANEAKGYMVQVSILKSLSRLPPTSREKLDPARVEAAIKRCHSLAKSESDELCRRYGQELLGEASLGGSEHRAY
ncbi:hypothetical protein [Lysobacter sp. Root667]|uniref:hypothetical protein n=1 Tax=Lysobacter sp. Root667 TaxID=1736581 RepID=UPI0012DEF99D|nr:hypothetical protein [Lysobacter sp. Root667]